MRKLILIVLVALIGWSAYWFVGKSNREAGLTDWFEKRTEAGWVAESKVDLSGYPSQYKAVLNDLALANPENGWAWFAPKFELQQSSVSPNSYVALWPEEQTISSPTQEIKVKSKDMRANIDFEPRQKLELNRATLRLDELDLSSSAGWGSLADEVVIAIKKSPEQQTMYEIGMDANNFRPSTSLLRQLDKSGVMPATFETLKVTSTATLSNVLSKKSFENGSANLENLKLDDVHIQWGNLSIRAKGEVTVDGEGYPTGKVTIRAKNWQRMVEMAVEGGAIKPSMGRTLLSGLGIVASLSGNKNELDVPLRFGDRAMRMGPITIGTAPRLKFP